MTTKDKVDIAFNELEKAGYFAKQDFWCCMSCGLSAIPDGVEEYVFYHNQDNDAWNKEGELESDLHLAWGGDPVEITEIFKRAGVTAICPLDEGIRIVIPKTV